MTIQLQLINVIIIIIITTYVQKLAKLHTMVKNNVKPNKKYMEYMKNVTLKEEYQ